MKDKQLLNSHILGWNNHCRCELKINTIIYKLDKIWENFISSRSEIRLRAFDASDIMRVMRKNLCKKILPKDTTFFHVNITFILRRFIKKIEFLSNLLKTYAKQKYYSVLYFFKFITEAF